MAAFQVRFRRPERPAALERYTTGLLTELPNKNGDTIAQGVPGTSAQRLQEFLSNMQWDKEDLNRQRAAKMIVEASRGDGVFLFDGTGFPKQGKALVGVARQYSGTLGKVGNCQIAVTCCYSNPRATWPVAERLYLPKTSANDPMRRQQVRVPEGIPFQTKPEIALALLDQARAWGVPHRCVVADADYGDNPNFLAGLEARQKPYIVAVRTDFLVSMKRTARTPVWRADALLQSTPREQWCTVRWRRGTKGWLRKKFVAVQCRQVSSDGPRHEGWLVGERATRGQPEERKYFWSNLPPETPLAVLAGLAHQRHAIEQFHEEAKGELGWHQYQGRLWPGFQRHAVMAMLAYSLLVSLEQRHRRRSTRQGRPDDAFPPSADAPALEPPGRASRGGPVAAAPGRPVVGDYRLVH